MDSFERMLELSNQGFYCAQIPLILLMESEEKENPDLIRALGGLNGGLGLTGNVCGSLTGGCCLLSYFAGKGKPGEEENAISTKMIVEFVEWFQEEYGSLYGSFNCRDILEGDPINKTTRCPLIVEAVYYKCAELLEKYEIL